jgi:nicotinamide-nucleotide amidase
MAAMTAPRGAVARVIAIGSELLTLGRTDTNSPYIATTLQAHGIEVAGTAVVGDDLPALTETVRHAVAHADLVVCTGGLGPTADDRTRDVVADVLGLPLSENAAVIDAISQRFERRGMAMPEINRRQAMVPPGATVLPNDRGTAPGLWIPHGARAVLLLPGPPREMHSMLDVALATLIEPRWGGLQVRQRTVIVGGRSESWVDEQVQPIYGPWEHETTPLTTTILASLGTVELHVRGRAADVDALDRRLDQAVDALCARLGRDVVSRDGASLEEVVGHELTARGWTLALAESCTGGLVTGRLTDVAGSSRYVDRAVVSYSNAAKEDALGVPAALLAAHGAVSEPVAVAMADGVRVRAGADVGIGITGIAGPGGGSEEKPVGMVCFAVTGAHGRVTRTARFPGDRLAIRSFAATAALDMLRRYVTSDDLAPSAGSMRGPA